MIPSVHPNREFSRVNAEPSSYGTSIGCEAGHTKDFDVGFSNVPTHYYTYIRVPTLDIWWDSDTKAPSSSKP